MKKPDFRELKKAIRAMRDVDCGFEKMFAGREEQKAGIRDICSRIAAGYAREELYNISVDELKNAKAGIRVSALEAAGFKSLGDLEKASDHEIQAVEGIGEKQTETIRHIINEFANSLSSRHVIRLDMPGADNTSPENSELIRALYIYMECEKVRSDSKEPAKSHADYLSDLEKSPVIKNSVRWLFSGAERKAYTIEKIDEIYSYCESPFFERLYNLLDLYEDSLNKSEDEACRIFSINNADFYALLENLDSRAGHKPFVYDSIPAQIADEVDLTEVDDSAFSGNLRAYQTFGVKYILHQKKVLLGDEMGLGKTIQAIAVMAHLSAKAAEKAYFLVVCPASVLINWDREIKKFSHIRTFILHGQTIDDDLESWRENGGAAITNYESMEKIIDGIDEKMSLSMLVVDEAHYIKNPEALRTQYIRRLYNESAMILMMTGTPLENRVDEMCNLIEFIRPDMVKEVRQMAHISSLPQFREKLAPFYIRRTRKQVLTELPAIEEKQEWCEMTGSDLLSYAEAVATGSFMNLRRVSFYQEDTASSAKINRLLELCDDARDEGRKVVVFSFFRETIDKVSRALGNRCAGTITGDTKAESRQLLIDEFGRDEDGFVLVCQIQAGGVGLNIQAASIVIFCEPQIKPSLTWQALSRVYRMGQVRNVLVYHLLCAGTVDEDMIGILEEKQLEFKNFADESVVADAYDNIMDKDWIKKVMEKESRKYLPMVI